MQSPNEKVSQGDHNLYSAGRPPASSVLFIRKTEGRGWPAPPCPLNLPLGGIGGGFYPTKNDGVDGDDGQIGEVGDDKANIVSFEMAIQTEAVMIWWSWWSLWLWCHEGDGGDFDGAVDDGDGSDDDGNDDDGGGDGNGPNGNVRTNRSRGRFGGNV